MKKLYKAIRIYFATPFIFLSLLLVYGLFSKLTGIISIALELFFVLVFVSLFLFPLLVVPYLAVTHETNKYKRILFIIVGFTLASISAVVFSPQEKVTRFYSQTQRHLILHGLQVDDVSYITIDDVIFMQPEIISPIIEALNDSTWYSPNHERRGKEVPMTIVLRNGQSMDYHVSRFYDEDSADLLFIRPHDSGFWVDGNALVPNLPSVLENAGYKLSREY